MGVYSGHSFLSQKTAKNDNYDKSTPIPIYLLHYGCYKLLWSR